MDILEKALQEWSYRTKKGYPDLNSKEDLDLFESMFGFRLEGKSEEQLLVEQVSKDSIINLVNNLEDNPDSQRLLQRVYRTLIASPHITKLKQKFIDAGLTKDFLDGRNLFDEIINVLQKGSKSSIEDLLQFQEHSSLPLSGNIYDGNLVPGIDSDKLKKISAIVGQTNAVTIGRGEILFPLLFTDIRLKTSGAGDFLRGGKTVELKALGVSKNGKTTDGGRIGTSREKEKYNPIHPGTGTGLEGSIKQDIESSANEEDLKKVVENINRYMNKIYPNNKQKITLDNYSNFTMVLKKAAVESYIHEKEIDEFLFFNPVTGEFRLIKDAHDLVGLLDTGDVKLSTDTVPKLRYFST